jgi:hypothetical protein
VVRYSDVLCGRALTFQSKPSTAHVHHLPRYMNALLRCQSYQVCGLSDDVVLYIAMVGIAAVQPATASAHAMAISRPGEQREST